EVAADGQHGEVEAAPPNQLHVGEEGGVAGVVDPLPADLEDRAHGHAAVGAVGERVGVPGRRELHAERTEVPGTSHVHAVGVQPARCGVVGDLGAADDLG